MKKKMAKFFESKIRCPFCSSTFSKNVVSTTDSDELLEATFWTMKEKFPPLAGMADALADFRSMFITKDGKTKRLWLRVGDSASWEEFDERKHAQTPLDLTIFFSLQVGEKRGGKYRGCAFIINSAINAEFWISLEKPDDGETLETLRKKA